jgi:tRNA(His) 5'-end guanylyltransferase
VKPIPGIARVFLFTQSCFKRSRQLFAKSFGGTIVLRADGKAYKVVVQGIDLWTIPRDSALISVFIQHCGEVIESRTIVAEGVFVLIGYGDA